MREGGRIRIEGGCYMRIETKGQDRVIDRDGAGVEWGVLYEAKGTHSR